MIQRFRCTPFEITNITKLPAISQGLFYKYSILIQLIFYLPDPESMKPKVTFTSGNPPTIGYPVNNGVVAVNSNQRMESNTNWVNISSQTNKNYPIYPYASTNMSNHFERKGYAGERQINNGTVMQPQTLFFNQETGFGNGPGQNIVDPSFINYQLANGLIQPGTPPALIQQPVDRPHFQKLYSKQTSKIKKVEPAAEQPNMVQNFCKTPCWIVLGILGLLAVVLGMLFGLGVLGGLPSFELPKLDKITGDVMIEGAAYYNKSITVETTVLQKNDMRAKDVPSPIRQPNDTDFRFPPKEPSDSQASSSNTNFQPIIVIPNKHPDLPIDSKPISPEKTMPKAQTYPQSQVISPMIKKQNSTESVASINPVAVDPIYTYPFVVNTTPIPQTVVAPVPMEQLQPNPLSYSESAVNPLTFLPAE